jgi:hypothetical protein
VTNSPEASAPTVSPYCAAIFRSRWSFHPSEAASPPGCRVDSGSVAARVAPVSYAWSEIPTGSMVFRLPGAPREEEQ